jgi:hypothetical protein
MRMTFYTLADHALDRPAAAKSRGHNLLELA